MCIHKNDHLAVNPGTGRRGDESGVAYVIKVELKTVVCVCV